MLDKVALIVEDTEANRIFFERLVTQAGFTVKGATTGSEALGVAAGVDNLALALIDMEMPDISGLDLTHRLRQQFPNICLVVATMHDEYSLIESAFVHGCDVFLVKPHGFIELFKRLTTLGTAGIRKAGPLVIDQYGPHEFKVVSS